MEANRFRRLQNPRLASGICGTALVAALACADPLVARLLERTPEPAATQPVPKEWTRYVTQPGDTLGAIASCRGVPVERLAKVNRIAAPDRLSAGATLRVPPDDRCAGASGPMAREIAPPGRSEARGLLDLANSAYDAADFEQALAHAQSCIRTLAPASGEGEGNAMQARCHLIAGMAAAGLEQRGRAVEEFRLALDLDPEIALDPERSSPRVLELVDEARTRPSRGGRFVETSPP